MENKKDWLLEFVKAAAFVVEKHRHQKWKGTVTKATLLVVNTFFYDRSAPRKLSCTETPNGSRIIRRVNGSSLSKATGLFMES